MGGSEASLGDQLLLNRHRHSLTINEVRRNGVSLSRYGTGLILF
jgi:hypothetical protein